MSDNKPSTENFLERWYKDFTGDKLPARFFRTSDPKLRERAGLVYRSLGFILCLIVGYLSLFGFFQESAGVVRAGIGVYLGYLSALEIVRFRWRDFFDNRAFRVARIALNAAAVTWLMSIPSDAKALIGLFYSIPIFATIVYFPEDRGKAALSIAGALACLYLGGAVFSKTGALTPPQYAVIAAVLLFSSWGVWWFQKNIVFGTDIISQISVQLYGLLDIDKLADYIVQTSVQLAHADRSLLIIIDPVQKEYVKHAESNLELKPGCTIEDVVKKCYVLRGGRSFESDDLFADYDSKDIYSTHFKSSPRSVFATPLFNRNGQVVGVLNVASGQSHKFDAAAKALISSFSYIASIAVENSLTHRQLKLVEIKSRDLTTKFAKARDRLEIFDLILGEIRSRFPDVNCVVHKLEKKAGEKAGDVALEPAVWHADIYTNASNPSRFKYGTGLTGHALKLREPILANDVGKDPRYVKREGDENIKSLLVCPIHSVNGAEEFGVINLFADQTGFFKPEDEFVVTSLAHQASLAFSRMQEAEKWQEQGGNLRKILNEVRYFDFSASDEVFCGQLAEAAVKFLGFDIARIRLLDTRTDELVTVAFSAPSEHMIEGIIGSRMPISALEPFITNKYEYEQSYIIPQGDPRWEEVANQYFYIPNRNRKHKSSAQWRPYDAILTPMIDSGGKLIGFLTLDLPQNGAYPNRDILEPIGLFANVAAWAVQLCHFQRSLADQRERTKSFIETISAELAQGHDIQTLGEVVVQVCEKFMNVEGCNLYAVKENEVALTHSSYLTNTDYIGRHKPVNGGRKGGLTGWVINKGMPLLFNNEDHKKHPAWGGEVGHLSYLKSKRCQSLLIVPIKDKQDRVIGAITLENKKSANGPGEFDDHDRERLSNIAHQFSKARERIGRYEAIKKWENRGLEDDLHFLINWYRFGVVANIEQLQGVVESGNIERAKELMPELLHNARTSVDDLMALHTIIINDCLEAKNLKEGLERLVNAWRKRVTPLHNERLPLNIALNCPEDANIDIGLQNIVIRFASEALSNAIFHSGIINDPNVRIGIEVHSGRGRFALHIADNGAGMKIIREGLGIGKIKELVQKANTLGGFKADWSIKSEPGHGTRVSINIRNFPPGKIRREK